MHDLLVGKCKIYGLILLIQVISIIFSANVMQLILPDMVSMIIFFFSIIEEIRPNYFFLILLGAILDSYLGSIIGVTSLSYIIISLIASSNKKALSGQKFNIVWAAFGAAITLSELLRLVFFINFQQLPNISILIEEYCLNIVFYPIMHYIIACRLQWFRFNA